MQVITPNESRRLNQPYRSFDSNYIRNNNHMKVSNNNPYYNNISSSLQTQDYQFYSNPTGHYGRLHHNQSQRQGFSNR